MDIELMTHPKTGAPGVGGRRYQQATLAAATLALLFTVGLTLSVRSLFVPAVVDAQLTPRVRVGILSVGGARERPTITALVQRLKDLGCVEGPNLTIDFRMSTPGGAYQILAFVATVRRRTERTAGSHALAALAQAWALGRPMAIGTVA